MPVRVLPGLAIAFVLLAGCRGQSAVLAATTAPAQLAPSSVSSTTSPSPSAALRTAPATIQPALPPVPLTTNATTARPTIAPTAAARTVAPTQPPVARPLTVTVITSSYGQIAIVTAPGALCGADAYLPNGQKSDAAGLMPNQIADSAGSVIWTYIAANTSSGTGTHSIFCTVGGPVVTAQATFTVAAIQPPLPAGGGQTLQSINGRATLVASDGTYLGIVSSSRVAPDSTCNKAGIHGSSVGPQSVRNQVGIYGSNVGPQSAYNSVTPTPPAIIYLGQIVGYLTKNVVKYGGVDPEALFAFYGCS